MSFGLVPTYRPLPTNLRLGFSKIDDIGVFAKEKIEKGTKNTGKNDKFDDGHALLAEKAPPGGSKRDRKSRKERKNRG